MGQEQPKYHVTDDGKVFVVNDDGTTTEYGHIVPKYEESMNPHKPIPRFVWWVVAILVLGVAALCTWAYFDVEESYSYETGYALLCGIRYLLGVCGALAILVIVLAWSIHRLSKQNGED